MVKKFRKKGGAKKRNTKIWIMVVAGIMLLSALSYMSYSNQPSQPEAAETQGMPTVTYSVSSVGNTAGDVEIAGVIKQLVLLPNDISMVDRESVDEMYNLNASAVKSVVLESTNAYAFFRFDVEDADEAEKQISEKVRLPGGYSIYRVYAGRIEAGEVEVIGLNLTLGGRAKVLLFQNANTPYKLVGFAQAESNTTNA